MKEYTVRFHADFGYADVTIEAETPEHALEQGRAMPVEALCFEHYEGYGDIQEVEVFEDDEVLAEDSEAFWLSDARQLRIAAPELLEALQGLLPHTAAEAASCAESDLSVQAEAIWRLIAQARAAIAKAQGLA